MRNADFSRAAFIAGAVLLVASALHLMLGAFGLALLAISAAVGDVWPAGDSRSRSYRR
jgi:hypothetical protein